MIDIQLSALTTSALFLLLIHQREPHWRYPATSNRLQVNPSKSQVLWGHAMKAQMPLKRKCIFTLLVYTVCAVQCRVMP